MMGLSGRRQSQPLSGVEASDHRPVDGTEPTEVAAEVFCGDATEPAHPFFQAAMVGVNVLDMPRAINSSASGDIDGAMLDTQLAAGGHHDGVAFCAENDIRWQNRLQCRDNVRRIIDGQYEVGAFSRTVTSDQDRHLFMRYTAFGGLAAAVSGQTPKAASLPFVRTQKIRLVNLGNAAKQLTFNSLWCGEKSI